MDLLPSQMVDLPTPLQSEVRSLLGEEVQSADVRMLDRLYADAYEKRREAGRLLKALGEIGESPAAPEWLQKDDDPAQVRATIYDAIGKLRRERDGALNDYATAASLTKDAQWKLQQAEDALTEVNDDLSITMKPEEIKERAVTLGTQLSDWEEINAANDLMRATLSKELGLHDGNMRSAQSRLEAFRKLGSECPTCGHKMTPVQKRNGEEALVKMVESASREAQQLRIKLEAVAEPKPIGEVRRKIADLEAVDQKYWRLVERKKALEETIINVGKQQDPLKTVDAPNTAEMDARLTKGEEKLQALDRYIGLLQAYRRTEAEAKIADKEKDALDHLVEVFGPSGIRLELTAGAGLDEFEKQINTSMSMMGFTVDLGPLLQMKDDPYVNGRPARFLSKSQMLRFSMAFAIAVSGYSGLGLVCVDEWDSLDEVSTVEAGRLIAGAEALQRFVFVTPKRGLDAYKETATTQNGSSVAERGRWYVIESQGKDDSVVGWPGGA